jgi:hypothetical protein
MKNTQSARTQNKAKKAILKPTVKRLVLPSPFLTVTVYSTVKGLVFLIPQGMEGTSFQRWKEAHQDEITEWLKTL